MSNCLKLFFKIIRQKQNRNKIKNRNKLKKTPTNTQKKF